MYEELQRILSRFDYSEALSWFKTHVSGKYFLKEMLSTGEDQYNRSKLIEELRAIEESFPKTEISLPLSLESDSLDTRHSTPVVQSAERRVVESAAPTLDLALLDQEWKPKYKEANHYFERLEFMQTEEERKEAGFRILELMDEVEQIWQKKDFIQKFGQSPDFADQGIEALTVPQMATRINTLRSYISKANKGKLSKDKISTWEAEKAELERRLRG